MSDLLLWCIIIIIIIIIRNWHFLSFVLVDFHISS